MGRTPVRARLRLAIYPLAVSLLMLLGGVAYASPGVTVVPAVPIAAAIRQQGRPAPSMPSPKPAPPVTTVLASSAHDGLRSDLGSIAARSGGRVSVSLQE